MSSSKSNVAIIVRCSGSAQKSKNKFSDTEESNFDVYLSNYGTASDEHLHFYPGGKWEGIYDFFSCHPDILDSYEYIWLPDDDLEVTPEAIQTLISTMSEHDLWLAQPALTATSQMYWPITLRCAEFKMRYTTFVELMAPCFKSGFLRTILPSFKDRRTGYGLDQYWAYWTDNPAKRCAIVDSAVMTHPKRKQASGLYRSPDDAYAERDDQQGHYGIVARPQLITGAVALDGSEAVYNRALTRQVFRSGMKQLVKAESVIKLGRFLRLSRELRSNTRMQDLKSIRPLPFPSEQE